MKNALFLKTNITNNSFPIDNFDKEAADANQNGEINVADITVIVDKIMNAGIESSN